MAEHGARSTHDAGREAHDDRQGTQADADAAAQPAHDDVAPDALTLEQAMLLAGRERHRMGAVALLPVAGILVAWGVAWCVGFLGIWLSRAASPVIAPPAAWILFGALLVAAVVTSGIVGSRIGRGIRGGEGGFVGGVYGLCWSISPVAITALGVALARAGADSALLDLFYPSVYAIVVGVLYIAGAAMFRAVPMIPLGAWILAVGSVAPFFGTPTHYLVMSIAAGGSFLVGAAAILLVARIRIRREVGSLRG